MKGHRKDMSPVRSGGDSRLSVRVKTCCNCGHVFVEGYHGSVGIQFWLSALTLVGGIAYWAMRGRGERCPLCKKKAFIVRQGTIIIDATDGMIDPNSSNVIRAHGAIICSACGREAPPKSAYCEGCGKMLNSIVETSMKSVNQISGLDEGVDPKRYRNRMAIGAASLVAGIVCIAVSLISETTTHYIRYYYSSLPISSYSETVYPYQMMVVPGIALLIAGTVVLFRSRKKLRKARI